MFWAAIELAAAGTSPATSQLDGVANHLATVIGRGAALAFGLALLASGLSSAAVGTLAGETVMADFINRQIPALTRRLVTMAPALAVLALTNATARALMDSQIVLSIGIPFALVPLLVTAGNRALMVGARQPPGTADVAGSAHRRHPSRQPASHRQSSGDQLTRVIGDSRRTTRFAMRYA